MKDWLWKYKYQGIECAYEELKERFGILEADFEVEKMFLIPKGREDIRVPFKFYRDELDASESLREESLKYTQELDKKYGMDKIQR